MDTDKSWERIYFPFFAKGNKFVRGKVNVSFREGIPLTKHHFQVFISNFRDAIGDERGLVCTQNSCCY